MLIHQLVLAQRFVIIPLPSNFSGLQIVNLHAVISDEQSHLVFQILNNQCKERHLWSRFL